MVVTYFGVLVGGVIVWLLLKWAEEVASDRNFLIAKIVLVVVVFLVEFFLMTVMPQVGEDTVRREYGPSSVAP